MTPRRREGQGAGRHTSPRGQSVAHGGLKKSSQPQMNADQRGWRELGWIDVEVRELNAIHLQNRRSSAFICGPIPPFSACPPL